MQYGFLDDAGDVGSGPRSSRTLVVREVKKFRTRLRKKKRQIPELKASQSVPAWNRKRLERLAKLDIEMVVVIAEKTSHSRFQEPEELYRLLCARAVEECLRASDVLHHRGKGLLKQFQFRITPLVRKYLGY